MIFNKNQLGIFFIILGMTIYSFHDLSVKLISQDTSILQIFLTRGSVGVIVTFLILKYLNYINISGSSLYTLKSFTHMHHIHVYTCIYIISYLFYMFQRSKLETRQQPIEVGLLSLYNKKVTIEIKRQDVRLSSLLKFKHEQFLE